MNERDLLHADLNGTRLAYVEVGAGAPCLVMHGGLGVDHTPLREWLDPLGDVLRLVYYDHRGNGRSGRAPRETMTLAQLVDDAEALRLALGYPQVVVLGHSVGGCVAIEYALRHRSSVSHLVLVDTTPSWEHADHVAAALRLMAPPPTAVDALFSTPATDADVAERERRLAPLGFHRRAEALHERLFRDTVFSASAWDRGREMMLGFDRLRDLGAITCPTLVVAGGHDPYCPPAQAERLHRGILDCELVILSESAHYPFAEEPVPFRRAVRRWLLRSGAARRMPLSA